MKQLPSTLKRVVRIWSDSALTPEQRAEAEHYEKAIQRAADEWQDEPAAVSFATAARPAAKEDPHGRR
jgi:hypothetical protein